MTRRRKLSLEGTLAVLEDGTVDAVLLREGMSKNGNQWPRATLEKLAGLVNGTPVHVYDFSRDASKTFLQHWGTIKEQLSKAFPGLSSSLPERLASTQVGEIAGAYVTEGADGVAELRSKITLGDRGGFFRGLVSQAARLGRDLGLSIYVPEDGLVTKPLAGSSREMLDVSRVVGFDVVTFPSAGGRVLPVLEALVRRTVMRDWLIRLLRLVPEDHRSALEALGKDVALDAIGEDGNQELREGLVAQLKLDDVEGDHLPAVLEAMSRIAPEPPKKAKKPTAAEALKTARAALEALEPEADPDAGKSDVEKRLTAQEAATAVILKDQGVDLIDAVLEAEKLPGTLGDFAKTQLGAVLEARGSIDRTTAKAFVADLRKGLGGGEKGKSILEANAGGDSYGSISFPDWTTGERCEAALSALIGKERFGVLEAADGKKTKVPAFTGIRQAYQVITGDWGLQGSDYYQGLARGGRRMGGAMESINWDDNPFYQAFAAKVGAGLEAAQVTATFPLLLSREMHKRLLREYRTLAHVWNELATTVSVSDFKQRNIVQFGEFGQLVLVNEASNPAGYVELAYPTEDDITATIAKYGGTALWSWESIVNDDLKKFQKIPGMMARAAERTLNTLVWGKILNNSNIYDGTALFTAGHGNLTALAWSLANAKTARKKMTQQKDLNDMEAGRFHVRKVFCGPEKSDEVWEDIGSAGKAQLSDTRAGELGTAGMADVALTDTVEGRQKPNVLRTKYGLEMHEVHEFDEVAGSVNDVYLADNANEVDIMEVGFLNGQTDPALFVQDLERVGSMFDDDIVTWKVRHVHDGGVVTDFRGFQALSPP